MKTTIKFAIITLLIISLIPLAISSCREDTSYDAEMKITEMMYDSYEAEYIVHVSNKQRHFRMSFLKADYFNNDELIKLSKIFLGKNIVVSIETNGTRDEDDDYVKDFYLTNSN